MQETRAAPATLEAVIERITYANEETGYTVARVATDRSGDPSGGSSGEPSGSGGTRRWGGHGGCRQRSCAGSTNSSG
jgi:exodeoxyribonuclease V alpha subunit